MKKTIEIEESSFIVRVKGQDYEISYPTVEQSKAYIVELQECKTGIEVTEAVIGYLDKLGFPRAISEKMQEKNIHRIIKTIQELEEEEKKS